MKRLLMLLVLGTIVASCASCGVRGDPELPPGKKTQSDTQSQ